MKNGLIVCMGVAVGFLAGVFSGSSFAKSDIVPVNLTMENDCRMLVVEHATLEKNYSALKGSCVGDSYAAARLKCVEADRDFLLKQWGIMPYEVQCPGVGG